MKTSTTRLDYCQYLLASQINYTLTHFYLLASQINYTLTHFADHCEQFSHDAINPLPARRTDHPTARVGERGYDAVHYTDRLAG